MRTFVSRSWLALIAVCTLPACNNAQALADVCSVFTELSQQAKLSDMSHEQRMAFVNQRVTERLWSFSQVSGLWKNVANYEATARYRMFKRTAEDLLDQSWHCPDMQRLAPTLSEPIPEPH
jgi:hypothetical protein